MLSSRVIACMHVYTNHGMRACMHNHGRFVFMHFSCCHIATLRVFFKQWHHSSCSGSRRRSQCSLVGRSERVRISSTCCSGRLPTSAWALWRLGSLMSARLSTSHSRAITTSQGGSKGTLSLAFGSLSIHHTLHWSWCLEQLIPPCTRFVLWSPVLSTHAMQP